MATTTLIVHFTDDKVVTEFRGITTDCGPGPLDLNWLYNHLQYWSDYEELVIPHKVDILAEGRAQRYRAATRRGDKSRPASRLPAATLDDL